MNSYYFSLLLCSGLSVISSTVLIVYYTCSKKSRTYQYQLVLPVFLYDFFILFDWFLPLLYATISPDSQIDLHICRLQGFLKLWRTNGTFFSTLVICWILYTFFIRNVPLNHRNPITYYANFTIILPLSMSVIPLITNKYGYRESIPQLSKVLCSITIEEQPDGEFDILGMVQKIVLQFLPFLLTICIEIYLLVRILIRYLQTRNQLVVSSFRLLVFYPFIMVISQIWVMCQTVYQLISGGDEVSWLNDFDLQMSVLNGFMNAVIYVCISLNIFCCSSQYSAIKPQRCSANDEYELFSELNSVNIVDSGNYTQPNQMKSNLKQIVKESD